MQYGRTVLSCHGEHTLLLEPTLGGIVMINVLLIVEIVSCLVGELLCEIVIPVDHLEGLHVCHLVNSLQGVDDILVASDGWYLQKSVLRHRHAFFHYNGIGLYGGNLCVVVIVTTR